MATVMSLRNIVTIGYGTYNDVLITKDFIRGEPDGSALKYYAPDIGIILEEEDEERDVLKKERTGRKKVLCVTDERRIIEMLLTYRRSFGDSFVDNVLEIYFEG